MLLCISMIAALCGVSAFAEDAAVAEIGEKQYTSLSDAFSAAQYGDCTIKLLKNAEMSGTATFDLADGNLILDLNGYNIDFTGNTANVAAITVTATNYNFKITGEGTITAEGRALEINSPSSIRYTPGLIIDKDVTVISKSEVAIFLWSLCSDVSVYGTVKSLAEDAGAIMGNGQFTRDENKISIYDGAWVEAKSHAIYCPQTGSLNITGGTIKSTGTTAIEMRRGSLNISGNPTITTGATEFKFERNDSGATTVGAAVAIAPYDAKEIKVSISGGTFTGVKALSYENPNGVTNPVVSINVTGGTFSTDITDALRNAEVTSNLDDISIVEAGGKFTVGSYVAQAGNTKYTSLEAAFKAAEDGSTIKLLSDDTVNNQIVVTDGKTVTLDLNGKNVTSSDDITPFLVSGGELKVTGKGTVTSKLITFRSHANTDPKTMDASPIKAVLTIDKDVTVVSTGQCAVYYKGNGSVVNVYGTLEAKGPYATIQGNGTISDKEVNGGTVLNIYDTAVVKATGHSTSATNDNSAIYQPQHGVINIYGGELFSESGCGIEIRDGSLNISGGTITSAATKFISAENNNGATTIGAAVAIAMYGNGNRAAKLNISGGTFKGVKAIAYSNPNKVTNPDVTINVTGGTFSTDITDALTNADVKSNIKEYAVAANADGTYGVKARDEKFEKVAAVQRTGSKTLTFLAGIDYLDYEKAGFRVTVGSNTKEINTDTVYTELKDNGAISVSADKFSTNYFFAANFEVTDTTIEEFTITPFAKLLNGEEVTGTETKVKVGGAE